MIGYIGREVHVVVDPQRRETLSGREEPRRVVVHDYYPVAAEWQPKRPGLYRDLYAPAWEQAADLLVKFGLDRAYAQQIKSPVYEAAPRREGEFPVVILSPAMSLDQQLYQFLILPLVTAGYRVVTVGATYESMCTVFPDGEFVPHAESVQKSDLTDSNWLRHLVAIRRDDLRLVLDQMRLDKVGVVGHSLGGAAVFELARADERVKAVVLLDASFELMTLDRPVATPLLNLRQEMDSYAALRRMMKEAAARAYIDAQRRLYELLAAYRSFVRVENSLHISFCDVPWVFHAHVDWPTVHKVNSVTAREVTLFYDQFLRGQEQVYEAVARGNGKREGILPLSEI